MTVFSASNAWVVEVAEEVRVAGEAGHSWLVTLVGHFCGVAGYSWEVGHFCEVAGYSWRVVRSWEVGNSQEVRHS